MNFATKYKWLRPALLFTSGLLACRIVYSLSFDFFFILWNLFLGVVPLYCSYRLNQETRQKLAWVYLVLWLLFFPNAMYIVTDLFHLRQRGDVPLWYDLLLLFSAAVTGIVMGFCSLRQVERFLAKYVRAQYISWFTSCFFLLCGYGIYLGRYLRWNSWDVIAQPLGLAKDIMYNIIHPFKSGECWTLTLLFGVWLHIMYGFFRRKVEAGQ